MHRPKPYQVAVLKHQYSIIRVVHVLTQDLVHGEHVYLVLLEDRPHCGIASNHTLVAGIL